MTQKEKTALLTLSDSTVAVCTHASAKYPESAPYNPSQQYPEYPFSSHYLSTETNVVYSLVRDLFVQLGYDLEHLNKKSWNPLGKFIRPGQKVVIKPNAVLHYNQKKDDDVFASITHGSVLRAVIDYVYIALQGKGRIIVADAPLAHSDFSVWKKLMGLDEIVDLYHSKKFALEVYDLRNLFLPYDQEKNFAPSTGRQVKVRDPFGYVEVDLKEQSEFVSFTEKDILKLFGADYDRQVTVNKHLFGQHKYFVAKTMLEADVLISVPKMKTHCKVGTTLNIKGMVGTQGDKNYIPHHRIGPPSRGGDEFPESPFPIQPLNWWRMFLITHVLSKKSPFFDRLYQLLILPYQFFIPAIDKFGKYVYGNDFRGVIYGGSWYGNDTAWRMALDLIKINLYCDASGQLHTQPQRVFFSIVDGIVAGEDDGPLAPTAFSANMLIAGSNPLAVDVITTQMMGFLPKRIKMYKKALQKKWLNRWCHDKPIIVKSDNEQIKKTVVSNSGYYSFIAPRGWRGTMENTSITHEVKRHYDEKYFAWQKTVGEFGGQANLFKFAPYIKSTDTVLDFGSGGGFLLKNLQCQKKIGIEINPVARKYANSIGIYTAPSPSKVSNNSVDVIISNHCLEHCQRPIDELKTLYPKIKHGGRIIIVIPCERKNQYAKTDQNKHLYTWSPMNAGNMLEAAGFEVLDSHVLYHTWPMFYRQIQHYLGWGAFHFLSGVNARFFSEVNQVRVIGIKK